MNPFLFADAAISKPEKILGLWLRPYSIGHEILLTSERNALVITTPETFSTLKESDGCFAVIRAVLICSRNHADNLAAAKSKFPDKIYSKADFEKAVAEFRLYRDKGSTFPNPPDREAEAIANAGSNDDGGRQLGSELMPRLINFLCFRAEALGYGNVYDIPYGLALNLFFTDLEMEGRLKIENDRERQCRKELDEHMAAIKKEIEEAACPR